MGQPGPGLDLGPTDAKRNLRPNCEALRSLPRQTSVSCVPRAEDRVLARLTAHALPATASWGQSQQQGKNPLLQGN